uniref:Uncharacterized protein n=1 Tax=Oryza punctata TaxID=4537 RepID=A0A0E0KC77_ORYPU
MAHAAATQQAHAGRTWGIAPRGRRRSPLRGWIRGERAPPPHPPHLHLLHVTSPSPPPLSIASSSSPAFRLSRSHHHHRRLLLLLLLAASSSGRSSSARAVPVPAAAHGGAGGLETGGSRSLAAGDRHGWRRLGTRKQLIVKYSFQFGLK